MTLSGSLFETMEDDSDSDMSTSFGEETAPVNPAAPKAEVLEGFDLSNARTTAAEELVDAVAPIDSDNVGKAEFNNDFMKELIAQTVPSSALGGVVDDDLLAAVKEEEAKYAVQPTDADKGVDFDMDAGAPRETTRQTRTTPWRHCWHRQRRRLAAAEARSICPSPRMNPSPSPQAWEWAAEIGRICKSSLRLWSSRADLEKALRGRLPSLPRTRRTIPRLPAPTIPLYGTSAMLAGRPMTTI